jgi:NTF2-like N-terminal transpeptidase domain
MRRNAVVIAAAVAVLVAAGVAGVAVVRSRFHPEPAASTGADPGPGSSPAPVGEAEAAAAARAFLASWAAGQFADAAAHTDDPTNAEAGLTEWSDGLKAREVTITPGDIGPAGMTFTVALRVGATGKWRYDSSLQVVEGSDGPVVS